MRLFLLCLAAFLANSLAPARAADTPRPNILLICVDDLKPLLGCYGNSTAKSPHIDRLATRGLTFDRAYTNQAVCSPSRNALMTGLRPGRLGIYDLATHFRLAVPDAITLPQHFKTSGWRTEGIGKIFHAGNGNHEDPISWSSPFFKGFAPTLRNPATSTKTHTLHTFPRQKNLIGRALRTAQHRLVEWKIPGAPAVSAQCELYDYNADPSVSQNLATSQPETVATLRAILASSYPESKPQIKSPKPNRNSPTDPEE